MCVAASQSCRQRLNSVALCSPAVLLVNVCAPLGLVRPTTIKMPTMRPIVNRINVAGSLTSAAAGATRTPRRLGSGKFRDMVGVPGSTELAWYQWHQRASDPNMMTGPLESQSYMRVSGSHLGMNPRGLGRVEIL